MKYWPKREKLRLTSARVPESGGSLPRCGTLAVGSAQWPEQAFLAGRIQR